MNGAPAGLLFVSPPVAAAVDWARVLPVLVALPAVAILLWGMVRGRLPPHMGVAALVLTLASYGFGMLMVMEESKDIRFCGSCHVMTPIVESLRATDGESLAAIHYTRGLVPTNQACYTCHSGYGIWGTFDIASCLGCHAGAASFRAVEAHQALDLQEALLNHSMSCTGACHPAAHPAEALSGAKVKS